MLKLITKTSKGLYQNYKLQWWWSLTSLSMFSSVFLLFGDLVVSLQYTLVTSITLALVTSALVPLNSVTYLAMCY